MGFLDLFKRKEKADVKNVHKSESNKIPSHVSSDVVENNDMSKELISACNDGRTDEALRLINTGANINAIDHNNASALIRATSNDLVEVANLLIAKGCDTNIHDNDGWTALYIAATQSGDKELVSRLLQKGAKVNEYPDSSGPILIKVLEKGFTDIAELLIANGVDCHAHNKVGWTPLECAEAREYSNIATMIKSAIPAKADVDRHSLQQDAGKVLTELNIVNDIAQQAALDSEILDACKDYKQPKTSDIEALLKKGAHVNARDENGNTPLINAADGCSIEIVELLVSNGADVNAKDSKYGDTPLLKALCSGQKGVVSLLVSNNADVNATNKAGRSPLYEALLWDNKIDCIELLISKGADVNAKEAEEGRTPLILATAGNIAVVQLLVKKGAEINAKMDNGKTPLSWALDRCQIETAAFLIANGADVNAEDRSGNTPLSLALEKDYQHEKVFVPMVELLISKGANINSQEKGLKNPLIWAWRGNHGEIVKLLVTKGADVNTRDFHGWTPLTWAAAEGHAEIAQWLVSKGADINVKAKFGETPLSWALKNGHKDTEEFLKANGGKES
jgi:ankyrin repeat protein